MKRRVYATYWPERLGTVIVEGEEVSEIAWDGGGVDRFVSNSRLRNADVKPVEPRYRPEVATGRLPLLKR